MPWSLINRGREGEERNTCRGLSSVLCGIAGVTLIGCGRWVDRELFDDVSQGRGTGGVGYHCCTRGSVPFAAVGRKSKLTLHES